MRQLIVYGSNYIWNGFDFYKRILGHPDEINAKEISLGRQIKTV
jgi:hypothetical protein